MAQIKPLQWKDGIDGLLVHTPIGMFTVETVEGGFVYTHHQSSGETKGYRVTLDEAKARCAEIVQDAVDEMIVPQSND